MIKILKSDKARSRDTYASKTPIYTTKMTHSETEDRRKGDKTQRYTDKDTHLDIMTTSALQAEAINEWVKQKHSYESFFCIQIHFHATKDGKGMNL